jgi:hypothetical protein
VTWKSKSMAGSKPPCRTELLWHSGTISNGGGGLLQQTCFGVLRGDTGAGDPLLGGCCPWLMWGGIRREEWEGW